jgi:hypothetical protein
MELVELINTYKELKDKIDKLWRSLWPRKTKKRNWWTRSYHESTNLLGWYKKSRRSNQKM